MLPVPGRFPPNPRSAGGNGRLLYVIMTDRSASVLMHCVLANFSGPCVLTAISKQVQQTQCFVFSYSAYAQHRHGTTSNYIYL